MFDAFILQFARLIKTILKICLLGIFSFASFAAADDNIPIQESQDQRIKLLEEKVKQLEQSVTNQEHNNHVRFKRTPQWVKLGGELEYEYVDTESDSGINNPNGRFQLDKFTLQPLVQVSENITLDGLLIFKDSKASVSEVFVLFSGLPFNSTLKFGLDDIFINERPVRKTESFAMIDTAFARDDEYAVTWAVTGKSFYLLGSLSNGYKLATASVAEDKSYKFIHDDRQTDK